LAQVASPGQGVGAGLTTGCGDASAARFSGTPPFICAGDYLSYCGRLPRRKFLQWLNGAHLLTPTGM